MMCSLLRASSQGGSAAGMELSMSVVLVIELFSSAGYPDPKNVQQQPQQIICASIIIG
jgi:hypothetical protein